MKKKDVERTEDNNDTFCTQHPETCSNPYCTQHN